MPKKALSLSRKELYRRVWAKPLSAVATEVGLSSNALAKICNRLLVPYPSRGHWAKINVGKFSARSPLPPAPELQTQQVTISSVRASSRRVRTRLQPAERRDHLIEMAEGIIRKEGMHAASMKRLATVAGVSETQVYNYFGSREKLLIELARREFQKIEVARQAAIVQGHDHPSRVELSTRAYLQQMGERGWLLQMLLMSPEVRAMRRKEQSESRKATLPVHTQALVDLYGISHAVALGSTAVLTRLTVRTGQLIADGKLSPEFGERLCVAMVLNGSRDIVRLNGRANGQPTAQSKDAKGDQVSDKRLSGGASRSQRIKAA
jgi:AcrR family transcriptional regulator